MGSAHPFTSASYAAGLAGERAVIAVPEWGSHMIRRPIDGGPGDSGLADAMGTYPLQVFARGADVPAGLARLASEGLVSATVAPDPLLCPAADLARAFEVCRPFKAHYVIDPALGPFAPSRHHRQELRRAAQRCRVERVSLPEALDDWRRLYAGLVARRAVGGAADFSAAYFDALAVDPAMQAFAAFADGEIVGMAIWFAAEGVAYYHLSAVDEHGYRCGAAYALVEAAVAHFAGSGIVHLGGGAGLGDGSDGLAAFKRGFANGEVMAHICGAVLDPVAYARLTAEHPATSYFPAYRAPAPQGLRAGRA